MRIKTVIFFLLVNLYIYPSYSIDISKGFDDANALIVSGELDKAKELLKKILKENPNNMQIINNIAYIEAKSGNIDEAIKILRRHISNNKDIDVIYKNLTNLYAFQANILYEEALSIKESSENAVELSLIKNLRLKNKNILPQELLEDEKNETKSPDIEPDGIKDFITNWAKYWESKDYIAYFNCYESNYFPKNFKSKKSWQSDRKEKIENKKNIKINISNINIISYDRENILIQFTQAYNSDSFSDVVKKHTTAVIIDGSIKITGEYILK